jgi:glyoxylate/hydroxypyruvate reductase A
LHRLDIVVSILPLTAETSGMFDAGFFGKLAHGVSFVNVGRGAQVVESDLMAALDSGQLSHAFLDVFPQEPLAEDHPFWQHPKIDITPHIASITDPVSVVPQIVANYRRATEGLPLHNCVDRSLGY